MTRMHQDLEEELIREFGTATFSTRDPEHKHLGWKEGPEDPRDYKFSDVLEAVERTGGIQHWANPLQLNQGKEGACVWFANTGVINATPLPHAFGNDWAQRGYILCKQNDEWPGEDYDGTSVRAGGRVGVLLGHYQQYAMTSSAEELALFVLNHGPAVIGIRWRTGMDRVDTAGYVHATGTVRGGHAICIDGVVWDMQRTEPRFRFRNSWGPDWGFAGRGRISAVDMQFLLSDNGVACLPVEVEPQAA